MQYLSENIEISRETYSIFLGNSNLFRAKHIRFFVKHGVSHRINTHFLFSKEIGP